MSLEQALNDNTLVMRELIAAIKGMTTGAELASAAVREFGKALPEETRADMAEADDMAHDGRPGRFGSASELLSSFKSIPPGAVFVTPEPTPAASTPEITYFHDTAHRSVYKFGPTEPLNGVQARCERIDEATYLKLKAEYAALTEAVIANPTQATAAASTPPTAPVVAAPVSAPATTATPDWAKEVIPALMALAKKPATGQRQVQALLAEFGCAGKTVPAMQGLGKHAEIIASAQRRLASDEGL